MAIGTYGSLYPPQYNNRELEEVLKQEYSRELRGLTGRVHILAQEWNDNLNRRENIQDPYVRNDSFVVNYEVYYPEESQRIRGEILHMNAMEAIDNDLSNRITSNATLTTGNSINMTYEDLVNMQKSFEPPTTSIIEPIQNIEIELFRFLSDREDLNMWFVDLSHRLKLDTKETLEVALRMAMEIVYVEEEAHIAGLNKKLNDIEKGG